MRMWVRVHKECHTIDLGHGGDDNKGQPRAVEHITGEARSGAKHHGNET